MIVQQLATLRCYLGFEIVACCRDYVHSRVLVYKRLGA